MTARRMEIDNIGKEFGGAMLENSTRSEQLGGDGFSSGEMGGNANGDNSFGGNNSGGNTSGGNSFGGNSSGGNSSGSNNSGANSSGGNNNGEMSNEDSFGFDSPEWGFTEGGNGTSPGGSGTSQSGSSTPANTTRKPEDFKIKINDKDGFCPARADKYNVEDLSKMGIRSDKDIFNFIKSIGTNFGNIQDDELRATQSPLDGLKFTTMPQDLCSLLFSNNMVINTLDSPT